MRIGAKWQMGSGLRIGGGTPPGVHKWAIRYVVGETELSRSDLLQRESQVFPQGIDYLDAEFSCGNFAGSQDSPPQAQSLMKRTLMPLNGQLSKFALFQTRLDRFELFVCCHRIVVYGIVLALVFDRITDAFSANASAAAIASQCCIDEVSDQAHRFPYAARGRNPAQPFPPALGEPFVVAGINELSPVRELPRAGVITAGCALLGCEYDVEYSPVVPNFLVSRRVDLETPTVPAMISRVVRRVVKAFPGAAATGFGGRADTRMPVALRVEDAPRVEFDTDVFDAASIETLIGRFTRVLSAMTADWGRRS
jgi:hypothetical protein